MEMIVNYDKIHNASIRGAAEINSLRMEWKIDYAMM